MAVPSKRFLWRGGGYLLHEDGNSRWERWADLEKEIRLWGEKNYIMLRCVDSKRSEAYNRGRSRPFVEGHKSYVNPAVTDFAYKTFPCVYGGKRRRRGGAVGVEESEISSNFKARQSKTLDIGCPFRIHAAYKPHIRGIVITHIKESEEVVGSAFAVGHNHPANKDVYDRYPQNLKMSALEIKRQEELFSLGVTASQAARDRKSVV